MLFELLSKKRCVLYGLNAGTICCAWGKKSLNRGDHKRFKLANRSLPAIPGPSLFGRGGSLWRKRGSDLGGGVERRLGAEVGSGGRERRLGAEAGSGGRERRRRSGGEAAGDSWYLNHDSLG